ncbi:peptidase M23 [Micromonospora sp. PLK6-60]|uniref:peptidase M23 n=1 Tax=Micromonospora sp. PLK6-60 TaxID=2873383 RepID=UPI001CA5F869|nr:peptidase M23 [Micromonospora sp. PLK6-60]MBY8875713.1 peptidase M23 [Micromonospora sp. PLK6-60]
MRDDGTLDDQFAPEGTTGQSDDTPSSDRTGASRDPRPGRLLGRRFSRTRPADPANLAAATPARGRTRARVALATGVVCCLGAASFVQFGGGLTDTVNRVVGVAEQADLAERAAAEPASRGLERAEVVVPPTAAPSAGATPTPAASPSKKPAAKKPVKPKAKPKPKPKPKPRPKPVLVDAAPVAGLDRTQMANAKHIVRAAKKMGVPRRAMVIAVATAMQESTLLNYASGVLPESQNYAYEAIGWDHDSVGLFQQRPSSGWGTVEQLMDPEYATQAFLAVLLEIPGWQDLPLTIAAQTVQVSAFPDAYAQWEWAADEVVRAIYPTAV